jgi:sarcosine oxidase
VRAAARAYAAWADLEDECGERLVTRTGGADVFPDGAAIDLLSYTTSLEAAGVDHDLLDAAAAVRRWPGLGVPDGAVVLHQAATGFVAADRATAALRRRAAAHGAVLRDRTPVAEPVPLQRHHGPAAPGQGPGRGTAERAEADDRDVVPLRHRRPSPAAAAASGGCRG